MESFRVIAVAAYIESRLLNVEMGGGGQSTFGDQTGRKNLGD